MPIIKACLFDLDGVICDTSSYHYNAWKKLANSLGFDISPEHYENIKGLNNTDSLEKILQWGKITRATIAEKEQYAAVKNETFLAAIENINTADAMPGIESLFIAIKNKGLKMVLASSSKNAKIVLEKLQLTDYFDDIIDGNMVEQGKPDPEIYHRAIEAASVTAQNCLVFEDSVEGLKAAQAAACYTVGFGDMKVLKRANLVIDSFEDLTFDEMLGCIH